MDTGRVSFSGGGKIRGSVLDWKRADLCTGCPGCAYRLRGRCLCRHYLRVVAIHVVRSGVWGLVGGEGPGKLIGLSRKQSIKRKRWDHFFTIAGVGGILEV